AAGFSGGSDLIRWTTGTNSLERTAWKRKSSTAVDALRVRRDHGLRPAARRRVGERLGDAREGEARGDQPADAHPGHQGERPAKRGAAAEGADDLDLAVVQVPEAQ